MLSGNGRHRRPRQAPAIFVTAGMTGAGLAMPLLGATSAQAADVETWDRVAQCESGGLWSANTGNGYYGGLQLTQETWEQYGGTAYAERPDLASRSQQIAVAEKILADQGPDAWPSCGVNAGLRYDSTGEAPAIDPGNLLQPEEEPSAPSAERKTERKTERKAGSTDGSRDADDPAAGTGSDPGTDAAAGADADPGTAPADGAAEKGRTEKTPGGGSREESAADPGAGTGKHRGERDPREVGLEREQGRPADGQEAVPGGEPGGVRDERSGAADARTDRSSGRAAGEGALTADDGYRVQPGDSLSRIAEEHRVSGGWTELYETNKEVVGEDPDLILPGQELTLGQGLG